MSNNDFSERLTLSNGGIHIWDKEKGIMIMKSALEFEYFNK